MASHSEHFEAIKAALQAAKSDGFHLYVDNVDNYDGDGKLNLWSDRDYKQIDFPDDMWSTS